MLIVMAGLPGTGKTTLAQALAAALRADGHDVIVLNKDEVRAALFPPETIEYSSEQDDLCVETMLRVAAFLLDRDPDRKVILDGRTFTRRRQVKVVVEAAAGMHTPLRIVECTCPDDIVLTRLRRDQATGHHPASNRDTALYRRVKARAEPITHPHLDVNTKEPLEAVLEQVMAYVL